MTALEVLAELQPHLDGLLKEIPEGPAREAIRAAIKAAPGILGSPDAGDHTREFLEKAAFAVIQEVAKVLPGGGVGGAAIQASLILLPKILDIATLERVKVVYEQSDQEAPPEIV